MNVQDMLTRLQTKLGNLAPEFELYYKAELAVEILELKQQRNAVILGHNYMEPALFHSIPDFTGDSLDLSRKAATTDKDVIVFCGVRFMAETAKILNPTKTVLLPSEKAGCSLAASITAEDVRALKARFPGAPVVSYVNTYADVKAESDICCTSSNAVAVVESLKADTVIFLPDEYLARNVARETGKHIIFPTLQPVMAIRCSIINWSAGTDAARCTRSSPSMTSGACARSSPTWSSWRIRSAVQKWWRLRISPAAPTP